MSDLVTRLRLAASDLTATMQDFQRIVAAPVLSAQQEATIRVLTDAAAEIERLRAERDENEGAFKVWRRRCQEAERERDEAHAEIERLREVHLRGCECAVTEACQLLRERDEARAEIERLRRELEWKAEVVELPDKHPLRAERDEVVALLLACQEVLMNLVHYSDDDHAPSALLARLDAVLVGRKS